MSKAAAVVSTEMFGPSADVVMVTPQMARELRDTRHFGRQRAIYQSNVEYLAREMRAGWFVPGTAILFAVLPDAQQFLLNGNHTLEAVVKAGVTIPLTFIYVPCKDMDEAGRIYGRLDQQRRRNWQDAARAAGIDSSQYINTRWLGGFGGAVTIIANKFSYAQAIGAKGRMSTGIQLLLAQYYRPYAEALIGSMPAGESDKPNARLLQRAPVLAVVLETFRCAYPKAQLFWGGLVADDGLVKGDARKTLLDYLRDSRGKMSSSSDRIILSRACSLAWNAYYRGDDCRSLRPGSVVKFAIAGSDWGREDEDAIVVGILKAANAWSVPAKPSK